MDRRISRIYKIKRKQIITMRSQHTFHIPVMGTSFTIDTPLKVARYGITSVVSLVDDVLTEQMRAYYCKKEGLPYDEIKKGDEDHRARRLTAYLDMMDGLLEAQVKELQASPFEPGSQITRYYELLPECALKDRYREMLDTTDESKKAELQSELRTAAVPGDIDVNIMTKVDSDRYDKNGEKLPLGSSDALSALRGFARSRVRSALVLSAGMNPRLYSYLSEFDDFFPLADGTLKKRIILKVSDYRSAEIQGKFLAKRGIWVSEYRVESGLNCGGHAFASTGFLMGPILDEFRENRAKLMDTVWGMFTKAIEKKGLTLPAEPYSMRITVQGGIGTAQENELLMKYYEVDGTGWGTPFMLVPEATCIDDESLERLVAASGSEVYLSESSPFGIPFWNLDTSGSEEERRRRIEAGKPGTSCPKGFLKMNSEFGEKPICTASNKYIRQKLDHMPEEGLNEKQEAVVKRGVLAKACLCDDLAGAGLRKYGIVPDAKQCLCCGPNIVNFDRTYTLEEMVGHIYGKVQLITRTDRPHMLIRELMLYVDYFKNEIEMYTLNLSQRQPKYFEEFRENLMSGIENYQRLAEKYIEEKKDRFAADLKALRQEVENLPLKNIIASEGGA